MNYLFLSHYGASDAGFFLMRIASASQRESPREGPRPKVSRNTSETYARDLGRYYKCFGGSDVLPLKHNVEHSDIKRGIDGLKALPVCCSFWSGGCVERQSKLSWELFCDFYRTCRFGRGMISWLAFIAFPKTYMELRIVSFERTAIFVGPLWVSIETHRSRRARVPGPSHAKSVNQSALIRV